MIYTSKLIGGGMEKIPRIILKIIEKVVKVLKQELLKEDQDNAKDTT